MSEPRRHLALAKKRRKLSNSYKETQTDCKQCNVRQWIVGSLLEKYGVLKYESIWIPICKECWQWFVTRHVILDSWREFMSRWIMKWWYYHHTLALPLLCWWRGWVRVVVDRYRMHSHTMQYVLLLISLLNNTSEKHRFILAEEIEWARNAHESTEQYCRGLEGLVLVGMSLLGI